MKVTYSAHSVFEFLLWGARKSTPDAPTACTIGAFQYLV